MSKISNLFAFAVICVVQFISGAQTAAAQVDPSSTKRVKSQTASEYEESWNVKLFVDNEFNCTDVSTTNKFYIITDDEEYNRSEQKVAGVIAKALIVFDFASGPTRCVFDPAGRESDLLKFHAVVIYDDEIILDMPFEKDSSNVYFQSQAEVDAFLKKVETGLQSASIPRKEGETEALLASASTKFYITHKAFPTYHSTNTFDGLSLTICAMPGLATNGKLIEASGAAIKRVVPMKSGTELVDSILSGSCDIVPHSPEIAGLLEAKIAQEEAFGSADPDLIMRDKLELLMKAAEAKGSDFRNYPQIWWPRYIELRGVPSEKMESKRKFEAAYKGCTASLSKAGNSYDFAQRVFDCNCIADKGLAVKDYTQCATGYGYHWAKYKFFDFAKSYVDAPKGSAPDQAVQFWLDMSSCIAENFDKRLTESFLDGQIGRSESDWFEVLINDNRMARKVCGN